ncbi:uncharacterized protein F4817DRAFT_348554 [Daldinia loculata]|uniref:uncharacterized protein n=1 Tax=Daldinia loculata TaxID=103429 RepID=UPI0020C3FC7F|nr:uncharacterized protein F4817DRAFT_348554 [Daldinia loculata]KAI1643869.1 hypothetical protein F4817DRAFT_348554 [Daldinia loculata]
MKCSRNRRIVSLSLPLMISFLSNGTPSSTYLSAYLVMQQCCILNGISASYSTWLVGTTLRYYLGMYGGVVLYRQASRSLRAKLRGI